MGTLIELGWGVGRDSFPGNQSKYLVPRIESQEELKIRKFASSETSK